MVASWARNPRARETLSEYATSANPIPRPRTAGPEGRVAGVVLTQLLPFANAEVMRLFERFEGEVYEASRAA